MATQLTVRQRPATAAELADLKRRCGSGASSGRWRFVLAGCAALVSYGIFAGWPLGTEIPLVLAVVCGASVQFGMQGFMRRVRHRARRDAAAATVQELQLTAAAPVQIPGNHSSVEPAYAFECEGGTTVIVFGQNLWNPNLYGAKAAATALTDDEDDGELSGNGLPAPFTWPSRRFTIHRFPHSGAVLRIEVQGEPVRTEQTIPAALNAINDRECVLLACDLAGVQAAVDALAEQEENEFVQARRSG